MSWIYAEFAAVCLTAMLSPTTLSFSILALALGERPLRTGGWFYLGALTATMAIGVVAAFVIGDVATSSHPSTPKTWVAVIDVVAGVAVVLYAVWLLRRPVAALDADAMTERMSSVAASPAMAIVGAGAALANPGGFIPLALKSISETDPGAGQYIVLWTVFALVSLLPLGAALVLLIVARPWTTQVLHRFQMLFHDHLTTIAAVFLLVLAAALLRNGIAGLVS